MEFEWDPKKATVNNHKHGVTFQEATRVFGDPLAITFADIDHSDDEQRYLKFEKSKLDRLIVVSHTDRGNLNRLITPRLMTHQERKIYEEG
jgi:uncharacterized protein